MLVILRLNLGERSITTNGSFVAHEYFLASGSRSNAKSFNRSQDDTLRLKARHRRDNSNESISSTGIGCHVRCQNTWPLAEGELEILPPPSKKKSYCFLQKSRNSRENL